MKLVPPALRKRRLWSLADISLYAFGEATRASSRRALRLVRALEKEHHKTLILIPYGEHGSEGYLVRAAEFLRFDPARAEADAALERRVADLEERARDVELGCALISEETKRAARQIAKIRVKQRLPL